MNADFTGMVLGFAIVILVFLLCRELVCWYWKINIRLDRTVDLSLQLDKVEEELKKVNSNLEILNKTKGLEENLQIDSSG